MDLLQSPLTLIIIVANVLFSFIGFSNQSFLAKTIGWPYYTKRNKEYYRFITAGFLHADWPHLIFNMFTFYFFGSNLEFILKAPGLGGGLSFLAIYFLGMLAADIPSFLKHNNNEGYRSLGASGAVSAVVFACIVFSPWSQIRLFGAIGLSMLLYAVLYVAYCIYMGKKNMDNVNHDAHLWGSLFGLVFTFALVAIARPDSFPYIIKDLKDVQLFGTNELSSVLKYLFRPGSL